MLKALTRFAVPVLALRKFSHVKHVIDLDTRLTFAYIPSLEKQIFVIHTQNRKEKMMAVEKFSIEAGHIMMFSRAVGDKNPVYSDEDYAKSTEPGGIIAPPTFAQASAQFDPDYYLRPKIGEAWFGSGKNPTGITDAGSGDVGRGLHAEQHFEYHRHLKPGDVLSATSNPGKTWEKQGRRGGKLMFSEQVTEYCDQNGELVITARSVVVQTEKPASQD